MQSGPPLILSSRGAIAGSKKALPLFLVAGRQFIMKMNLGYLLLAVILSLSACSQNKNAVDKDKSEKKYNPGHYVAVGTAVEIPEIKYLDEPAVQGVNKRYLWRTLETGMGVYDFSPIEKDLDYLAAHDKQLVVFLIDRSFGAKGAMPDYLAGYELKCGAGFCPVRWHPVVVERLVELGKAMGRQFDSHPNFEGIAIQETSLDMSEEDYRRFDYTADRYRDALIAVLTGLQAALPRSHVFWYSNFMPEDDGLRLRQVADAVEASGVYMGGPDILPYNQSLSKMSYPMYEEYRSRLTLFCSAQDDSYRHHKNDLRVDIQEPIHKDGYLTMEEIFLFARDSLHVRYLFWNYYYEGIEPGERSYDDAIEVMRRFPTF